MRSRMGKYENLHVIKYFFKLVTLFDCTGAFCSIFYVKMIAERRKIIIITLKIL